jgi:hypothetical protein
MGSLLGMLLTISPIYLKNMKKPPFREGGLERTNQLGIK